MDQWDADAILAIRQARPAWWFRPLAWLLSGVSGTLAWVTGLLSRAHPTRSRSRPAIAVEAGEAGWTLLEFTELLASAQERYGASGVVRICAHRGRYLRTVAATLGEGPPLLYMFDPRTGSQKLLPAMWQALSLAVLLAWFRTVPVARLCDFPLRRHRLQVCVVTAWKGLILIGVEPQKVRAYLTHRRVVGPTNMALSAQRLYWLEVERKRRNPADPPRAVFNGTKYEPRTQILRDVRAAVARRGASLEVHERERGSRRESVEDVWAQYLDADVFFTTAVPSNEPGTDDFGLPHLTYRYAEALAAGAVLVAPAVPGASAMFVPGQHFLSYESVDEAADQIVAALSSPGLRQRLGHAGRQRVSRQVTEGEFWRPMDGVLDRLGWFR